MKVGAEPRKVAIFAVLLGVGGWLWFTSDSGEAVPGAAGRGPQTAAPLAPPNISRPQAAGSRTRLRAAATREFRPSLASRRDGEQFDPMKIDPTLRLDLLDKLQNIQAEHAGRNLFEFSAAPPPKAEEPKIIPAQTARADGPTQEPEGTRPEPPKPVKPPPPPITLKFYGYITPTRSPARQAFFLDGDDIFVAGEGDLIRKRYRVVRIGVNSAVVEDTEHKHQQSLPLVQQAGVG